MNDDNPHDKYICENCDLEFKTFEKYKNHIEDTKNQNCEKYKNVLFYCKNCDYTTEGLKLMKDHLKSKCKKKKRNRYYDLKEKVMREEFLSLKEQINTLCSIVHKMKSDMVPSNLNLEIKSLSKKINHDNTSEKNFDSKEEDEEKKIVFRKPNSKYVEVVPQENVEKKIEAIEKTIEKKSNTDSVRDLKKYFETCFDELPNTKNDTFMKIINKLKSKRIELLKISPFEEYKYFLESHVSKFNKTLKDLNFNEKKIKNILPKFFNPIDARILYNPCYIDLQLTPEEMDAFDSSLEFSRNHNKEHSVFDYVHFCKNFQNYGSVVLNISSLIKKYLFNVYGFNNFIYLNHKKSLDDDPYTFYKLSKKENNKLYWEMDCRCEILVTNFISDVLPYLTKLFRKIYCDIFHDNAFRKNFASEDFSVIAKYDLQQLLSNICSISNHKTCCNLFRNIIKENATKNAELEVDKFNILSDDSVQRDRFLSKTKNNDCILESLKILFDDITSEDTVDLLRTIVY